MRKVRSRNNHRYAGVVQDLATQLESNLIRAKENFSGHGRGFRKFFELSEKPKVIYTDNSLDFGKFLWRSVMESSNFDTSSIWDEWYCSKRAVRRIEEGTSAVLLQSGLHEKWWADSVECYCYLRNVQDRFWQTGKLLVKGAWAEPFKGSAIPFRGNGGMLSDFFHDDQSRLHQFGKKVFTWNISSDMH